MFTVPEMTAEDVCRNYLRIMNDKNPDVMASACVVIAERLERSQSCGGCPTYKKQLRFLHSNLYQSLEAISS